MQHCYIKLDRASMLEKTLLRAYLEALQYTVLWGFSLRFQKQHQVELQLLQQLEPQVEQQHLTKVELQLPMAMDLPAGVAGTFAVGSVTVNCWGAGAWDTGTWGN